MLARCTLRTMPLVLITQDRQLVLQNGSSIPLGRAHVGRCPEAMFVSRQQCLLNVSADGEQVSLSLELAGAVLLLRCPTSRLGWQQTALRT
jgi:hypothetical protein